MPHDVSNVFFQLAKVNSVVRNGKVANTVVLRLSHTPDNTHLGWHAHFSFDTFEEMYNQLRAVKKVHDKNTVDELYTGFYNATLEDFEHWVDGYRKCEFKKLAFSDDVVWTAENSNGKFIIYTADFK